VVVLDVLADEEPQVAFSKHDHAAAVRMRNCSGWDIGEAYASAPGAKNTCPQGLSSRHLESPWECEASADYWQLAR